MPFTHFALFVIFSEHQLKKFWNNILFCSFLLMTMHCTSNLLGKKKKKKPQQLKREKSEYP
jgi:hypothetical protein